MVIMVVWDRASLLGAAFRMEVASTRWGINYGVRPTADRWRMDANLIATVSVAARLTVAATAAHATAVVRAV